MSDSVDIEKGKELEIIENGGNSTNNNNNNHHPNANGNGNDGEVEVLSMDEETLKNTQLNAEGSMANGLQKTLGVSITFEHITYDVWSKSAGTTKKILKGISGTFKVGKFTAVMGSSGAGKTTLLSCVGGFIPQEDVGGKIYINGKLKKSGDVKKISAFVFQDDTLMETMTVKEAITMTALLRLPQEMSMAEKQSRVNATMTSLGLMKVQNEMIGSILTRGISGGERKRTSIAVEMVSNPQILFLDEPTSGLDSYMALNATRRLKALAESGRTIVTTIHQPSSDLFFCFDELLLLGNGLVIYSGPISNVVPYFASQGYQCPQYSNPADYIFMHILNTSTDRNERISQHIASKTGDVIQDLVDYWYASTECQEFNQKYLSRNEDDDDDNSLIIPSDDLPLIDAEYEKNILVNNSNIWTQLKVLSGRVIRNQFRNKILFKAKLGSAVFLGIVLGLLYLQIGHDQLSVQDRIGSLFFYAINNLFGSIMPTLSVFAVEKAVFKREYSTGLYGLFPYFFSKIIVELPINTIVPLVGASIVYWMIGYQRTAAKFFIYAFAFIIETQCGASLGIAFAASISEISIALATVPLVILPLMLFSGFFINQHNIPPYFDWIKYFSPMKYAFEISARNEFEGLHLHCDPSQFVEDNGIKICPITDGNQVINEYGLNYTSMGIQFLALLMLYAGFLLLAVIALYRTANRKPSNKKPVSIVDSIKGLFIKQNTKVAPNGPNPWQEHNFSIYNSGHHLGIARAN